MTKKLLLFFILIFQFNLFSQNLKLTKNASVSVFTCGKGEELYSTFGHTAIRLKDEKLNLDVVYNYGAFDFRVANFYLKFIKGDLQYFINASSYEDFIYEYQYYNRTVIEQVLNLSLPKKQKLFEKLNASLTSDESHYTYKFIDRNCTTMVAEKINESIGYKIITKVDDKKISYRSVLYPYFENYFWYKLGINIVFGAKTDKKAEQLFLPIELLNSLDKASYKGNKLVKNKNIIIKGNDLQSKFSFFNSIYIIIALLLLIVIANKKVILTSYLFFCGLLGFFLVLVGFYSLHKELLQNYNALLFNPILIFVPFVNKKIVNYLFFFYVLCLVIYITILFSKPHLLLLLPFIIANAFCCYLLFKKRLLTSIKKNRA